MYRKPTQEAKDLKIALEKLGLRVMAEVNDGHKCIDLTIPDAGINIEVDGGQHLTDPYQILSDLKRTHYSDDLGYDTVHIPNQALYGNLGGIASALAEAAALRIEGFRKGKETNIGYWEQVLQAPTPAYQKLFDAERAYLLNSVKTDTRVLDIGCGDGRNMRTILERTKFVTGIDNDEVAVKDALKNFSDISTVKVLRAEAVSLPFDNNSFDIVTFLMILPNLDTSKVKALTEAARVMKSDGKIILSTFAETAFDERMEVYKMVKAPIERIEGTKFIFDKSLGANVSEQFSREEIELLAKEAGLRSVDWQKVGNLAYICTLRK